MEQGYFWAEGETRAAGLEVQQAGVLERQGCCWDSKWEEHPASTYPPGSCGADIGFQQEVLSPMLSVWQKS